MLQVALGIAEEMKKSMSRMSGGYSTTLSSILPACCCCCCCFSDPEQHELSTSELAAALEPAEELVCSHLHCKAWHENRVMGPAAVHTLLVCFLPVS
jgi:hypothetical protein